MTDPPFDPAATCPKCGFEDVSVFYADGWISNDRRIFQKVLRLVRRRCSRHRWKMRRTCQRCYYAWNQAPIDDLTKEQR